MRSLHVRSNYICLPPSVMSSAMSDLVHQCDLDTMNHTNLRDFVDVVAPPLPPYNPPRVLKQCSFVWCQQLNISMQLTLLRRWWWRLFRHSVAPVGGCDSATDWRRRIWHKLRHSLRLTRHRLRLWHILKIMEKSAFLHESAQYLFNIG